MIPNEPNNDCTQGSCIETTILKSYLPDQSLSANPNKWYDFEAAFEYIVFIFSPIGALSNAVVIVSSLLVIRSGQEPKTAYLCLWNIAMADFINCTAFLFRTLGIKYTREKYFCGTELGLTISGSLISMLSIFLIAVERFIYIVYGIKYDNFLPPGRACLLICVIWITGLSVGLLPIIYYLVQSEGEYLEICEFGNLPFPTIVAGAVLAVPSLVFTPLAYTLLYFHVIRASSNRHINGHAPSSRYKSFMVVFLSSFTYMICWGPFIVCCSVFRFYCIPSGLRCHSLNLALVFPLSLLGFVNSLLNPMIYAWWHPPYNASIRKVLLATCVRLKKFRAVRN